MHSGCSGWDLGRGIESVALEDSWSMRGERKKNSKIKNSRADHLEDWEDTGPLRAMGKLERSGIFRKRKNEISFLHWFFFSITQVV